MTYLVYVAAFGCFVLFFLWIRDARIYYRTGYPGYRKAAWHGILYGAVSLAGIAIAGFGAELIGIGIILAALYLQGRITREKVWKNEPVISRLLGSAQVRSR